MSTTNKDSADEQQEQDAFDAKVGSEAPITFVTRYARLVPMKVNPQLSRLTLWKSEKDIDTIP